VAVKDRRDLTEEEILWCYQHDPATFDSYLIADLVETFRLYNLLAPSYVAMMDFVNRVLALHQSNNLPHSDACLQNSFPQRWGRLAAEGAEILD
jgi:hypothetical protein